MLMNIAPIVLEGEHVRLEPLDLVHASGLFAIGQDESIWRDLPTHAFVTVDDAMAWVKSALRAAESKTELPFATIERKTGTIVGATRYQYIRAEDRVIEIGRTWLGTTWWRTAMNTEMRLLLLTHAFEGLGAVRVQIKAAVENVRSQRAIERLGATREGVLRNYMIYHGDEVRDAVFYSFIDTEWALIKARLQQSLANGSSRLILREAMPASEGIAKLVS